MSERAEVLKAINHYKSRGLAIPTPLQQRAERHGLLAKSPTPRPGGEKGMTIPEIGVGLLDVGETMVTGAMAESAVGYSGILAMVGTALEPGPMTGDDWKSITNYMKEVEDKLTADIKTPEGERMGANIAGTMEKPAAKAQEFSTLVKDVNFDYYNEKYGPVAGAIAAATVSTAPELISQLMGLGGVKKLKGNSFKKVINKLDKNYLYDEDGVLKPEVFEELKKMGIDYKDVGDILPETIDIEQLKPFYKQVKKSDMSQESVNKFADITDPDPKMQQAMKEMGIDAPLGVLSNNPAMKEGIKRMKAKSPDSKVAVDDANFIRSVNRHADRVLQEAAVPRDKVALSKAWENAAEKSIKDLDAEFKMWIDYVNQKIPKNKRSQIARTWEYVSEEVKAQGGFDAADPDMQKLHKMLESDEGATFYRLQSLIGAMNRGQYAGLAPNVRKRIMALAREDLMGTVKAVAEETGDPDLIVHYKVAKNIRKQRGRVEEALEAVRGPKLNKSLMGETSKAFDEILKGNMQPFETLMDNVPRNFASDSLGPNFRQRFLMSAFRSKLGGDTLDPIKFNDYMRKLKMNKKGYAVLRKELGPELTKQMDMIDYVFTRYEKQARGIFPSRSQKPAAQMLPEMNNFFIRMLESRKTAAAAEMLTSTMGKFGAGTLLHGGANRVFKGTPKSDAAYELLGNTKFKHLVYEALSKRHTPKGQANINKKMNKIKAYQKWRERLTTIEKEELFAMGFVEWIRQTPTSMEEENDNNR